MTYQCDIDLSSRLDALTGLAKPGMDEEIDGIVREDTWPTFFEKDENGRKLQSLYEYSQSLNDTVAGEMARRFGVAGTIKGGVQWPGAFFVYRLSEIIGDLIRTKHPCLVPKIKPAAAPQPTAAETFEALKDRVRADIENPAVSSRDIETKRADANYRRAFEAVQTEAVNKGYGVVENAPAKPEASGEVKQFAFMFNDHYTAYGTPKCYGGFYALQSNGKRYEFPVQKFMALMDQAVEAGLLR